MYEHIFSRNIEHGVSVLFINLWIVLEKSKIGTNQEKLHNFQNEKKKIN